MKSEKIMVSVSGAGGYAHYYLKEMLDHSDRDHFQICSVFDPDIRNTRIYNDLLQHDIHCFDDYSQFKESLRASHLAVIVSPIHYHVQQAIDALQANCNVLLDKPLAGSLQQAHQLLKAARNGDNWVILGYQWSYSDAILKLKKDLVDGKFGRIIRGKTLVYWPRDYAYFNRNSWTGKKESNNHIAINDSLANNAMAHFIHNLNFLAGGTMESCAQVVSGQAELYRTYEIETFDSAVIQWSTEDGAEMLFYGSHVTKNERGPLFILECEKATIYCGELSKDIVAVCNSGPTKNYGNPDDTNQFEKFWVALRKCRGETVYAISARAAMEQTKIIDAIANNCSVSTYPKEMIVVTDDRKYIDGLGYVFLSSYQHAVMPSTRKFSIQGKTIKFNL